MKMKRLGYEICILTGCYLLLQLSALNLPEKLQYSALPPQPVSLVILQEFQSENRTPQSKLGLNIIIAIIGYRWIHQIHHIVHENTKHQEISETEAVRKGLDGIKKVKSRNEPDSKMFNIFKSASSETNFSYDRMAWWSLSEPRTSVAWQLRVWCPVQSQVLGPIEQHLWRSPARSHPISLKIFDENCVCVCDARKHDII